MGDLNNVSNQVINFKWQLFPFVLLLTGVNYILRFFKWHFYLGQIDVDNIPMKESARLFVAGFPLAVTPGKIGEGLKGLWLNQKSGTSVGHGVSVVTAERISDGFAVLILSIIGVLAYPEYWPAFASVFSVLLVIVIISQIRPLALGLINFMD